MIKQLLTPFFSTLLLFTLLCNPHFANAQNPTPNAGFEDWTAVNFFGNFFIPNNWDNLDSATAIIGILTCQRSTEAHSGTYAVKLVTYEVNIFGTDTANGIITTGNLIIVPPYGIEGGIVYHERPDSIACWIKYTPAGGDSTQIQFDLFSGSGDTIGTALLKIGKTVSNYTRFTAPVLYYSSATPELSRWMFSSSNGYDAVPGSVLYIDDISLLFTTGIQEVQNESGIQLINTLVSDQLLLSNPKHHAGKLKVYNSLGMLQSIFPVKEASEQFPLGHLSNGIYYCAVVSEDGTVLLREKIVVQQ
ncbi:MAG: hypothetical protein ABIO46_01285 [Chitinophagales bacterium]